MSRSSSTPDGKGRSWPKIMFKQSSTAGNRTRTLSSSLTLVSFLALGLLLASCHSQPQLPERGSKAYADVVSAFYVGLAALQVGDDVHAEGRLSEVTRLVPAEPAGWANWGVLALRQRNYDVAAERLERARQLAPQNDQIYDLLGVLESDRGHSAAAIADLRRAVELNPKNLRAAYALGEEIERQGDPNSEAEFQQVLQKILAAQPDNLAALLEFARIAAKRGDADSAEIRCSPDYRPLVFVAGRSAAATRRGAGCGRRRGFTRGRYAHHFSAQRPDARAGIPPKPVSP